MTSLLHRVLKLGRAAIITLGNLNWVEQSTVNFLPGLRGFLRAKGVEVVYARHALSDSELVDEFCGEECTATEEEHKAALGPLLGSSRDLAATPEEWFYTDFFCRPPSRAVDPA